MGMEVEGHGCTVVAISMMEIGKGVGAYAVVLLSMSHDVAVDRCDLFITCKDSRKVRI